VPQPIQNPQGPVILQAEIAPQGQSYEVPEIPVNQSNFQRQE